ncbi:MAG: sigma-54 interaction domain-containing protein [Desulfovibrionales bacterium]
MVLPPDLPVETILDSIADGVFTIDRDWNVTSFNQAAAEITGILPQEAVGRKCWEVFQTGICDGGCMLKACMEGQGRLSNKSVSIRRPDGKKVLVSISAAPLKNKRGEIIGGVETFRDITAIQMMRKKLDGSFSIDEIVSKSGSMIRILRILPQIAESGSTVLLLGESGTGKELFARAVHKLSNRSKGPFITVNCGALPANLLESELFGYKTGAFTGAERDKPGRFHLARGGTIFLDEIGDLPLELQVKILRVLQERSFEPLGAVDVTRADVRVVAATNRNLEEMVRRKEFRKDLFYRLNVVQLNMPPLRERREDIPLLIEHFVKRFNFLTGKEIQGLSEDVIQLLMRHEFPGNIRELENIIEYAFILCPRGFIQIEHLPESLQPETTEPASRPKTMQEIKRQAAVDAVERNRGKRMAACRELGITKDTLRRLLDEKKKNE